MGIKLIVLFLLICFSVKSQSLEECRKNIYLVYSNKDLCESMILQLENKNSDPIFLAYLGTYQTLWANHVINPITKLSSFNMGVRNIEKSFQLNSDDIEIRVLRYAVQKNAPRFLGYYKDQDNDRSYILKHKNNLLDQSLLKLIKSMNL